MRCPFCSHPDNRVIDSRAARDGRAIRRRRECDKCSQRFTTYELVEATRPDVVKQDGTTEPFNPDKVLRSLRLACKKRPVELLAITSFVENLDATLSAMPRKQLPTREVGDRVLGFLRSQDPVAYVRYASVYRSFSSVEEFMRELERIQAEDAPPAIQTRLEV